MRVRLVLYLVRLVAVMVLLAIASFGWGQFKVDQEKIPIVQARRRALVIGASQYQFLGKLNYAAGDARRFRDALVDGFRFNKDSIKFLSDSEDDALKPTSENILGSLKSLLSDPILDKGDLFILFFSGHGIGTSGGDYLCATDSKASDVEKTGLPVKEVINKLVEAKLRNVVIITDACRAGEKNEFGLELQELAKKANIAVMLGCEPGKKSYEAPQLKSGVFTYFLLKALSNPKTRTESGGLWTSKVAENLSGNVFEYTERSYGENAQRPVGFADPTSDVLLAKYIDNVKTLDTQRASADLKMVTNREKVGDELNEVIVQLIDEHEYAKALDLSKQAYSLNSENLFAAYFSSVACAFLGRSGEQEKYCDILKTSDSAYFRNLGYLQSDSRATDVAERIKALEGFWESSPKDEVHALIVWGKARIFLPFQAIEVLLNKMLPSLSESSRVHQFFKGEIAAFQNHPEQALAGYRAAIKCSESASFLSDTELTVLQFPLLVQLQRHEELRTLIEEQSKKENLSPIFWISAAANLKQIGDRDRAVELIKKGIKKPGLSETEVVLSAEIIGSSIVEIIDDLDVQVKLCPYSWKIRTIALIARGLKEQDRAATEKAFQEASKYCDDELEIISLTYAINDAVLEDAKKYLGVPADSLTDVYEVFRILFFNEVNHIGNDSEKWFQLGYLGASMLQSPYTLRLFKQYTKDFEGNSLLGSEYYAMLFQLATSVEDDKLAKFAVDHPALREPDRTDYRLLYSAYLVTKGNYAEAKKAFDSTKGGSDINQIVRKSLEAIFKARSGESKDLIEFSKQEFPNTEANLIAEGIVALTLDSLAKTDEALPHLKVLSEFHPTLVSSVAHRCLERYLKILKSKGRVQEADELLFQTLKVNQVSPGIANSYFGLKSGIENYARTISGTTNWFSDEAFDEENPTHILKNLICAGGEGEISMTISSAGIVSGTMEIKNGDKFVLSGSVDEFGNLKGEAKSSKKRFEMEAKLVSNEFRKTETFAKSSVGQILHFYNEKGLQTTWFIPLSATK